MRLRLVNCVAFALLFGPAVGLAAEPDRKPIKVFILAGQSNMQGHGHVRTLDWLGEDRTYGHLLKKVKKSDGSAVVRDDVWVYYRRGKGPAKTGKLTIGFGVRDDQIGPELMFGHVVGDHFDNPVLLIKTAWGGRSVAVNFRPPSAGKLPLAKYPQQQRERLEKAIADKKLIVGLEYREMVSQVQEVLANRKKLFPELGDREAELAGFVWFQGWNDMLDAGFTAEYTSNLIHLIKDLRRDLKAPKLPVVIGELGVGGKKANEKVQTFRKAQAEVARHPEFKGNVAFVETAGYWDETAQEILTKGWKRRKWVSKELEAQFNKMGSQPEYHYMGSARIYSLIGYGLAESLLRLSK